MKNIEIRAHETQRYIKGKEEKEIQDYKNWNEEQRQKLWNWYIFQLLQNDRWLSQTHEPELIDFAVFRNNNYFWEENPDKYLPWVLKELQEFYWDEWNPLEIIFILDEKAKKALEVSRNSEQIKTTILGKLK